MPQLLEGMLARWPVLYPEIAVAGEPGRDRSNEASGIRRQAVIPIPEATDIHRVFGESREEYRQQPS